MAKVSTSTHPLACVRAICGFTRDQVAKITGMSAANVQNVELGRAPMPELPALILEAATGCAASSLMGDSKKPLTLGLKPYDRSSYNSFRELARPSAEKIDAARDDLAFRVKLLLEASGDKFTYLSIRIAQFLHELREESGISDEALTSEARKEAIVEKREMTVGELRETLKYRPDLDEWLKARSIPDSETCEVVTETFRAWPMLAGRESVPHARTTSHWIMRVKFASGPRLQMEGDKSNYHGILPINLEPAMSVVGGRSASLKQPASAQPSRSRKRRA